jgi:hypothetical protein
METPKTIPKNKGIQFFTLLPVKSSFTMKNILIDKTAVQDWILGNKGSNIGEAHEGLYKTVRKLSRRTQCQLYNHFMALNGLKREQRSLFIFELKVYQSV